MATQDMITRAQQDHLVEFMRMRGNDPQSFRDAVHELVHVLYALEHSSVLPAGYTREQIRAATRAMSPGHRIESEARARAVEWVACERAQIPYEPEQYHNVAILECVLQDPAASGLMSVPAFLETIQRYTQDDETQDYLARALAHVGTTL